MPLALYTHPTAGSYQGRDAQRAELARAGWTMLLTERGTAPGPGPTPSAPDAAVGEPSGVLGARGATTDRPAATSVAAGFQFYDTTLARPVWSDGSVWRGGNGSPA